MLLLIFCILLYVAGWISVIADYIISGEMQRKRMLRKKLKDKSLSQMERDYIRLLLRGFDKVTL